MVKHSSPVNSQATMVHTYPGLPPIVESSPEAEDPEGCGNARKIVKTSPLIEIVKSFVEDKYIRKKRPGMAHILKKTIIT